MFFKRTKSYLFVIGNQSGSQSVWIVIGSTNQIIASYLKR